MPQERPLKSSHRFPSLDSSGQPVEVITRAIQRLRLDAPGARDQLWNLVYPWFLRLARILLATSWRRIPIEPEDLLHEAYQRVRLDDLVHDEATRDHLCGWVRNAMGWVLRDCARRMKVRQQERTAAGTDAVADVVAQPRGLTDDERMDLQDVLDRLASCDPKAMEVLNLYIFEGQTQAAVAESFGYSEGRVGLMLKRAFHRMREMDRGNGSDAALRS